MDFAKGADSDYKGIQKLLSSLDVTVLGKIRALSSECNFTGNFEKKFINFLTPMIEQSTMWEPTMISQHLSSKKATRSFAISSKSTSMLQ